MADVWGGLAGAGHAMGPPPCGRIGSGRCNCLSIRRSLPLPSKGDTCRTSLTMGTMTIYHQQAPSCLLLGCPCGMRLLSCCACCVDVQERRVSCVALGWLSGCVVVASCSSTGPEPPGAASSPAAAAAAAAAVASAAAAAAGLDLTRGAGAGFKCQLLLFPRNHLDFSSVVASATLHKVSKLFRRYHAVCGALSCTKSCTVCVPGTACMSGGAPEL